MKRDRIIYWITTGLLSAGMLMSAYMYLTQAPELIASFQQIGYPLHFVAILGTAKLLGSIALLVPISPRVKEWAYAGFGFTFIGAIYTHLATSTPWIAPAVFLVLTVASYFFWQRTYGAAKQGVRNAVGSPATA